MINFMTTNPLYRAEWITTKHSNGLSECLFYEGEIIGAVDYTVEEGKFKASGDCVPYGEKISSNPITEFINISSNNKQVNDEIERFISSYGFLFYGQLSFYANEFCFLSNRLRLLLEIIDGLNTLGCKNFAAQLILLEKCIEIQQSNKHWASFSWIIERYGEIGTENWESARGMAPCLPEYTFGLINIDTNSIEMTKKSKEIRDRLIAGKNHQFQDEDSDKHDEILVETLDLLIDLSVICPFYLENGVFVFDDREKASEDNLESIHLYDKIIKLAGNIIENEINAVVPAIDFWYKSETQSASIGNLNLFQLMYFSLMVMNPKKYRYLKCENPKCDKLVLVNCIKKYNQKRNLSKKEKAERPANGSYCCTACRKRHNAAVLREIKKNRRPSL